MPQSHTGRAPLVRPVLALAALLLLAACADTPVAGPTHAPPAGPSSPPPTAVSTTSSPVPTFLPDEPAPAGTAGEFRTDFHKHTVPYAEIRSGGPPKDGIPALDRPRFVAVAEADHWLQPQEPVILLQIAGDTRAYPIQIVIWHEIVNDTVGGVPVVVSFCPLCNTALAVERTVDGWILDFGTTGHLRYSNLIMYDRQTESWWQQASGQALAGALAGRQLAFRPAPIIAWADFKTTYPAGQVLSRDTGYTRPYGQNPYPGYDDVRQAPFLYAGPPVPGTLPAMARVVTVLLGGQAVAYPYATLEKARVINDLVGETPIVVAWAPGTASALDAASIAEGRNGGAATVFLRQVQDQTLRFKRDGDQLVDEQTGSTWDHLGRAIGGRLVSRQLLPVVSVTHFWFSWAAFRPDTRVYSSPDGAPDSRP